LRPPPSFSAWEKAPSREPFFIDPHLNFYYLTIVITSEQIIKRYKGKTVPFKSLPKEYQMAMIHYMAIDGEAWETPEFEKKYENLPSVRSIKGLKNAREWISKNLSFWIKKYGVVKFGMMEIPSMELMTIIFERDKEADQAESYDAFPFENFQAYHKWYVNTAGGLSKVTDQHYNEKWPVILGSTIDKDYEVLQDGWHRFHTYIRRKEKTIPVMYYV